MSQLRETKKIQNPFKGLFDEKKQSHHRFCDCTDWNTWIWGAHLDARLLDSPKGKVLYRRMMDGTKGRRFCLELSFIGWALLIVLPLYLFIPLMLIGGAGAVLWLLLSVASAIGGGLFLRPYTEAARAAFYRDVSGTEQAEAPTSEQEF